MADPFSFGSTVMEELPREDGKVNTTVEAMEGKQILEQALKLKPQERFLVVEALLRSLDEPDQKLDAIWAEEAEKRLHAYRDGRLKGIPMEEVFEGES